MADGKERPIHENHRARMQERVAHNGMESLAEHEVLEYMLYLAIPRQDTNPLAADRPFRQFLPRDGSHAARADAGEGRRPAQRPADLRHYGVWPLLCREKAQKAGYIGHNCQRY